MLKPGSDRIYSMESVVDRWEKTSAATDRTRPISGSSGDRYAAEPADRITRQIFPAAADQDNARRCDDGSIDVEFYKARDPPRRLRAVCPGAKTTRTLRAEACVRIH